MFIFSVAVPVVKGGLFRSLNGYSVYIGFAQVQDTALRSGSRPTAAMSIGARNADFAQGRLAQRLRKMRNICFK